MTSEQIAATKTALEDTGASVMQSFTNILPSIGVIIGIAFAIGFVTYWLKKLRKVR